MFEKQQPQQQWHLHRNEGLVRVGGLLHSLERLELAVELVVLRPQPLILSLNYSLFMVDSPSSQYIYR